MARSNKKSRRAVAREKQKRRAQRPCRLHLEALEDRRLMAISVAGIPDWQEQGPGPITRGQAVVGELLGTNARNDDFVTGPVSAIAVDPLDANRALVGTVSGGIWKTTNALAGNPV